MLWDTTVTPLFQTRRYLWSLPRAVAGIPRVAPDPGSQRITLAWSRPSQVPRLTWLLDDQASPGG